MDSSPNHASKYHHDSSPAPAASADDVLLFLAGPAGWLVRLTAFFIDPVASAALGVLLPAAALVGALRAAVASAVRRAALGTLAAACTFAVLASALLLSALLGFLLVRRWVLVEAPVTVRQPLYFDYTQAEPSAAVALAGSSARRGAVLPAGHSVRVSLALLLPDSYHNREVGMFQIKAEAVSVTGTTTASSTQPYMLRYKSTPVRLAELALTWVPLTLGMRSETQTAILNVLQYRESHGRHERTGLIRVHLQPRASAATVQLPQVYEAEVVVQSALPWAKELARGLSWTLCVWVSSSVYIVMVGLLAVCLVRRPFGAASARSRRLSVDDDDEKTVSDLGRGDFGDGTSKELVSAGIDTMKWRERRSNKRKAMLQTQGIHGCSYRSGHCFVVMLMFCMQ